MAMSASIYRFLNNRFKRDFITVVSGLPRSGTSMMMKMLEAGGLELLTDNLRQADDSNPKGYYELEGVKKLKDGEMEWLEDAQGKAVKVISALLEYLPNHYSYRIIFMRRNMDEILASQKKMLIQRGEPTDKISDEKLAEIYQKHLDKVQTWVAQQANIKVLFVNYNEILLDPESTTARIPTFLDTKLDKDSMLQVIDPDLYRQRHQDLGEANE